jgi:RND family efflux transporter MFP subunit
MNPHNAQQWLEILCSGITEAKSALFLMSDKTDDQAKPMARWPSSLKNTVKFDQIVKYALQKNEQININDIQRQDGHHYDLIALPIAIEPGLSGIISIELEHVPDTRRQAVSGLLGQAEKWLALALDKQCQTDDFYAAVVRLMATCYEQETYQNVLVRLVTVLTQALGCDRVAIGEFHGYHSKVIALSNSVQFDAKSNLIQKIADAMDESIEQDALIQFPLQQAAMIVREHQELARKFGSGSLLTIPMVDGGRTFGAMTLLRSEEKPFDKKTIMLCEQILSLMTPFLALKKSEEESLAKKALKTIKNRLAAVFGVKNLALKLVVSGVAGLLILAGLIKGDFRITADAILEGKTQRVVAAPVAGYLVSASSRAGDTVHKGDVMASLDDAELKLELSKLGGQLQKYRREYREALSANDLVKIRVSSAQIDQASAEMELTQQQLQQITLIAPYDGIVIEGDLSQKLGSPVERGDTLFKIAPLEGYRIILKVNERSISYVKPGQSGTLALSSMPEELFDLTVQKITAVAKADNGENIFRVEANLNHAPELLRPGMEGVGKINAGKADLLWIWTHDMVDWLRIWFWSWWF